MTPINLNAPNKNGHIYEDKLKFELSTICYDYSTGNYLNI